MVKVGPIGPCRKCNQIRKIHGVNPGGGPKPAAWGSQASLPGDLKETFKQAMKAVATGFPGAGGSVGFLTWEDGRRDDWNVLF